MLQPPQQMDAPFSPGAPDAIAALRAALHGRYEFERELGQGAFATVYLARDLKHERKVAIKVLNADPSSDTGELRFIREIRMLARLQHPNILPLHDSGHVEALLYYVMPYVRGDTLRDHLTRVRQMPVREASVIARDVADALAYAHGEGIIHRDIKPENILMSTGHPIVADFGIARVIDLVAAKQLTRTGMGSPGTPAYMSPEQLLGERQIDGRSDTYSLGCVLYEMLSGNPPFAGKEGFVKRFTEPPPDVRIVRREVSEDLNSIVMKALAREPRDRFQTAQDLVDALRAIDSGGVASSISAAALAASAGGVSDSLPLPAAPPAGPSNSQDLASSSFGSSPTSPVATRKNLPAFLALGVSLAVVAAALVAPGVRHRFGSSGGGTTLDTAAIAVLPLSAQDTAFGNAVAERIYDALHSWNDIAVIPDTKVAEILSGRARPPQTEDEAMAIARSLGAGKLIWGRVSGPAGDPRIGVHLFDVASKASSTELVVRDPGGDAKTYQPLVLGLLKPRNWPSAADGGDGLTSSYAAWQAYGRGHLALQSGRLDDADQQFSASLASDPQYPVAHLWLAQLREWRFPGAKPSWRDHALRAAASNRLDPHDRLLANALVALSEGAYPAACNHYRQLTQADSTDFTGWYGLGDCQSLDSLVFRAQASPSGWVFRSSNLAAAQAYQHAVRLAPAAHAIFSFSKLESLLPTAATRVRFGKSAPPGSVEFMASPSLMGPNDTLAFIPYPAATFSQRPSTSTATLSAAIAKNSSQLLDYTIQWVASSRNDPAAYESLADVLDVRGQIGDEADPVASALSALRRARALSHDTTQILRTSAKEAWVHFKRGEFGAAKKLADSVLASPHINSFAEAQAVVGLSALTGRVRALARLSDLSISAFPTAYAEMDEPLRAASADYFARAALGACSSFATYRSALDRAIDRYVAPAATATTSRALLARPLSLLVPCTGGRSIVEVSAPGDRLSRMQRAFALGRQAEFAALSDSIAQRIKNRRPGDLSPDFVYLQAWLRSASGDTALAIVELDRTLGALPVVSGSALREPGSAAAVVRAMILRADLAAQTGDTTTARKWATAVSILWADADAELASDLGRMRRLAGR